MFLSIFLENVSFRKFQAKYKKFFESSKAKQKYALVFGFPRIRSLNQLVLALEPSPFTVCELLKSSTWTSTCIWRRPVRRRQEQSAGKPPPIIRGISWSVLLRVVKVVHIVPDCYDQRQATHRTSCQNQAGEPNFLSLKRDSPFKNLYVFLLPLWFSLTSFLRCKRLGFGVEGFADELNHLSWDILCHNWSPQ